MVERLCHIAAQSAAVNVLLCSLIRAHAHTVFAASSAGLLETPFASTALSFHFLCFFSFDASFILGQGSDIWSSSIFSVFEDGCATCFLSMCAPFVVHGQNAERYAKKLDPQASNCFPEAVMFFLLFYGVPIAASAAAYFIPSISCTAGCMPFVAVAGVTQVPLRRKVRDMYGISERESCCGSDFLTSSCCLCCNLIQISRQLKKDPPNQRR
jgi:Cys-rich protein (TIGR01571 family)